ncbi:type VI secretion system tube protein TssD [Dysgonomonas sp. 511]|uniref:type VI secretion system tube protein TssD n=1 Tax=Dysgonomonas sp. 511 TaxID=2302930 RepID=UPI0013D63BFA|nr:type VI secretion system tube protein TssD [Dysgonomonas sp. 511]NDV78486.1 hypothetical protein [Dysgonomonas sp. 511]
MGFFDKIRSGRLFFGKKEPSMVVHLRFKGKKYIVEEFDLEFGQDINFKNKPDSQTQGGRITVTISDIPDENINSWMMDTYKKEDGEFRFLMNDGMIREGAQLHIQFKDAYCTNYQKIMNPQGAGVLTTLVISPRHLRIGNEEYENKW